MKSSTISPRARDDDIVLCDRSAEFPDDDSADHLPDRVYVPLKSRSIDVKLTLPNGETQAFQCPEPATFSEFESKMSDSLGMKEFIVRVNGKALGGGNFLCAELFKVSEGKIDMFPLVVQHRFEVLGVPFLFEVGQGVTLGDLHKFLGKRLVIERLELRLGEKRLGGRPDRLPLFRDPQRFEIDTKKAQHRLNFLNLDTNASLPTQTLDWDAKVIDAIARLKKLEPGEYRFFDGDNEIFKTRDSPVYLEWPGPEAIGFRCTRLGAPVADDSAAETEPQRVAESDGRSEEGRAEQEAGGNQGQSQDGRTEQEAEGNEGQSQDGEGDPEGRGNDGPPAEPGPDAQAGDSDGLTDTGRPDDEKPDSAESGGD
jgi:hypothetical protein